MTLEGHTISLRTQAKLRMQCDERLCFIMAVELDGKAVPVKFEFDDGWMRKALRLGIWAN